MTTIVLIIFSTFYFFFNGSFFWKQTYFDWKKKNVYQKNPSNKIWKLSYVTCWFKLHIQNSFYRKLSWLEAFTKNLFLKWRLATWLYTNTLDTKSFWELFMKRLCCFCIFDILFPSSESYIFLILIVPWFSWTAPYLRNLCH